MENTEGIDITVSEEILSSSPSCAHGPTLLFERSTKTGRRQFYACSACRDRKSCSFFQWADVKNTAENLPKQRVNSTTNNITRDYYIERWENLKSAESVNFCKTCSKLLLDNNEVSEHTTHEIQRNITTKELQLPTYMLQPLENNKKEAQYYFATKTTDFILETLKDLGFISVICLGCPRIFERINQEAGMNTILLDIDERLQQFYSPNQLVLYNMFNHYFFNNQESIEIYENFLRTCLVGKLIIVMDPPFGGMVEPLALTLKRISNDWRKLRNVTNNESPAVFWMFPYFMEKKILTFCPDFKMLDYQIDYDNHKFFKSGGSESQRFSPIRIFTNISTDLIVLPKSEGYRFCSPCKRFVSRLNKHCPKCNFCTSKNGRPYWHCDICKTCTKSTYKHFDNCGMCCPLDHKCGQNETSSAGCYICGDLGHKKRQCRSRQNKRFKRKR